MFFWISLAFSMILQMLAIWSLVPLPFLKPAWTSGSSWFTYSWSLAWRILSITLLAWRRQWQPIPVFLPGEFHGRRSLVGYSPWGRKESHKTERLHLLACEMSAIVGYFEYSLALRSFTIFVKMDLFQSCGHCWVFQICWHIECSTFIASSFRMLDAWCLN